MPNAASRCLAGMLAVALVPCVTGAAPRVTVSAGTMNRHGSIAHAEPPAGTEDRTWVLRPVGGDEANLFTAHRGPDGRMWFAVNDLRAGASRTYEVVGTDGPAPEGFDFRVVDDGGARRVVVTRRSKPSELLRYQAAMTALPEGYEPQLQRGGYIHPVYTPDGVAVTDDYPPNHKHHHGIWSPWTKTLFEGRSPDFWNMGDKTGTVEVVGQPETWSSGGYAGFRAKHRMIDLTAPGGPKPALDEQWDVTAYAGNMGMGNAHVFDLVITQTCASDSPLQLPKYHYGGLGFRGNRQWDGKENCKFQTSEGKTRADGNETRAKWCHVGGLVDGKPAGVAILCHPDNFRFPQPVRLHPEEPFFCFAPSQLGDWSIEPGKPYVAKYRFIVTDGDPHPLLIERSWQDYAEPVKVTVEP
jgi:hypothetical protein